MRTVDCKIRVEKIEDGFVHIVFADTGLPAGRLKVSPHLKMTVGETYIMRERIEDTPNPNVA